MIPEALISERSRAPRVSFIIGRVSTVWLAFSKFPVESSAGQAGMQQQPPMWAKHVSAAVGGWERAARVLTCTSACLCFTTLRVCSHSCSSFLQQLEPVLCIVRGDASGINGLAVVHEKHQILADTQTHVHTRARLRVTRQPGSGGSYPVANPGDDGVQVVHFPLEQEHPGPLPAGLIRVVQHHVQEVPQFAGDARVLEKSDMWLRLHVTDSCRCLHALKRRGLLQAVRFMWTKNLIVWDLTRPQLISDQPKSTDASWTINHSPL